MSEWIPGVPAGADPSKSPTPGLPAALPEGGAAAVAIPAGQPVSLRAELEGESGPLREELQRWLDRPVDQVDIGRLGQLIGQLVRLYLDDLDSTGSTYQSLMAGWQAFADYCQAQGTLPLPATSALVIRYLEAAAPARAVNTLVRDRWAIRTLHNAAGLPDPTAAKAVGNAMARIAVAKGKAGETVDQASPLRDPALQALVQIWRGSDSLTVRRDLALVALMHSTLLREAEAARLRFKQIKPQADGTAAVEVYITKTNKGASVETRHLSAQALTLLREYVSLAQERGGAGAHGFGWGEREGLIFRRVTPNGRALFWPRRGGDSYQPKPMLGQAIDKVFGRAFAAVAAGADHLVMAMEPWTGHSARVGACQDLLAAGFEVLQVQQAGGWTTPAMVYHYGRDILQRESAMARFAAGRSGGAGR